MKLVITGALGHIGSALIRELPRRFAHSELILIDNLLTQRYCSLFNLPETARYRFIECDVLTQDLEPIFQGADAVVHLAAITEIVGSYDRQEEVERVNFEGTKKVGAACVATKTPLLFLSTTSVYTPQGDTVHEDCAPADLQPSSPYAQSKLRAEQYLGSLHQSSGLEYVICRFGTIFGISPGMRFHTAVNKFCWQTATKQPISVWTTAFHQMRPYLDLADAISTLCFILERKLFDCSVYNVVSTNCTVNDVIESIRAFVPEVAVEYVDSKAANSLSFSALTPRLEQHGIRPQRDLRTGVEETLRLLGALSP